MPSEFAEFTEAMEARRGHGKTGRRARLERVAVLGGGPDALLTAALCMAAGMEVTLFSAYGHELDLLKASSGITLRGAGPVGTYQVDRENAPSIKTTSQLDTAVKSAELIFLTGPIHKQRTYAMVLADHLSDGQALVMCPARSLGALEAAWMLRAGGCRADITIIELQGLPYWRHETGSQLSLSESEPMLAATLPSGRPEVVKALMDLFPGVVPVDSTVDSSFHDGSALVEIPALLLAGPALEPAGPSVPAGGVPLPENETFANLIGADQRAAISTLAEERRAVAAAFGARALPSAESWTNQYAGAPSGNGSRPVPGQKEARQLIRDGVIGSLTPLISAAEIAGVKVPLTRAMVTMSHTILGSDVAAAGRRLERIGIAESEADSARKAMDRVARGASHGS